MSFRIEVEELKKRTKCNRCGRTEHWARECRQPRDPTSSTSAANKSIGFKGKERGASYVAKTSEFHLVETAVPSELSELLFVAAVCNEPTMIQRLQASESQRYHAVSQDFFWSRHLNIIGARTLDKLRRSGPRWTSLIRCQSLSASLAMDTERCRE